MGAGESELVTRLNKHFDRKHIQAFAYRQPQVMRRAQKCDITVDSQKPEWFLAIEVKSRMGHCALNFMHDFQQEDDRKEHQLVRLCKFADKTGRTPIVYYVCRGAGKGGKNLYYSFDAYALLEHMNDGNQSIYAKDLSNWNISWFDT